MVYEMQLYLLFIDRLGAAITDKYPLMKQWVRGKIWGNLGRGGFCEYKMGDRSCES